MGTMEFKVNRETFTASQIALDTTVEQAVERDFVLPDYYPDIFRILKCRVIPKIMSHSINGEKNDLRAVSADKSNVSERGKL